MCVLASSHCCTVSKGAIFCAIGGATPQKTKAPKLLSRAPLSTTFGAPGPFRGTFQGQAAPIKRHKGLTPRKHITSNRCAPDTRQASEMYGFETFTSLLANRARPRESVMNRCAQLDSGQCGQCGQCGQGQSSHLDIDIRPPLH